MTENTEPEFKTCEKLVPPYITNTKDLEHNIRKYSKWAYSRPVRRAIDRKWREYNKKDDTEKDKQVKQLLREIAERKEKSRKEITEKYIKEGRNIHHANTWKSIQFHVKKELTEEFGMNPDNLEGISIAAAKRLLFPDFEKQVDPIIRDNWIFDKNDEDLDPISKLAKHDAKAWVAKMIRLELYRQAKKNGRLGMYQDQKGKFQI